MAIVLSIHRCKSVRIAVQFSYESIGDRGDGIKSMVKILAGIIPHFSDNKKSVQYIFSKFPENKKKQIYDKIANIRDCLSDNDKEDTILVGLLQDMATKT